MGPGSTGIRAGTAGSGSGTTGRRPGSTGTSSGNTGILLLLLGAATVTATPTTAPSPCASDQLRCGDGSCLSRSFACDGDRDCPDGEDELGCPSPPPSWPCDPSFFTCRDGSCIAWLWRCDGDPDCRDGNDEENCGTPPPPRPCPSLQFPCGSGECVHRRWRCDGTPDCRDGSDEEGCGTAPPCPSGQLRCRDGRCIPGARACDGTPDCRDGDDEEECPDAPSCSPPHRFRCRSGECIATAQVCDGQRHCRDWSDEPLKECGVNECLAGNGGCSHGCRDLRVGFECLCPPGFSLNPDNRTCHSPPGTLLVSTRHEVLALGGPEPQTLQRSLKHVAALDIGVEEGSLFWGDPSEGLIYRAPLAPGPAVPLGVVPGPGSPAGIALDWIHRLLYWTEPGSGRVAVSDRSGTRHRTLHRDPDARPWGVVVDPLNGYLYWSDWGSRPHIAQGAQDGAPPKLLVTEDMERPQGLALDQSSQRLYWTDGRLHTVSSVALDGSGRRTHLRDPQHLAQPFGLAVFQDWAFWTDPHQGSLVAARLQGGSPTPQVVAQELFSPEAVVVLHPGRQPAGPNLCEGPGGLCSFLCLPSPARGPGSPRFRCACPDGEHLDTDGHTCVTEPPGTPELLPRNFSREGNASRGALGQTGGPGGARPGVTALGVLLPLGLVLCLGVAARALWQGWHRRNTKSISFTNATFRKGPADPLDGGGLGDPLRPLTSEDDEP
ncbi:low-density lipoprotein receptor-like isoform X2 [Catharus ustulatus]|uniref:low-density lipoprotein receptor-like isoform X2 n=1 Tax=Catharus ustulatus TaxID=91951 RepID=UPI00140C46F1|nr:low-density lipoprotein receptor-like isoform X2 [Catharus ustulatus]